VGGRKPPEAAPPRRAPLWPAARTMAGAAPRVHYLAGFSCPLGGLAAGKPRVLCHEAEVFLSTGSKFVYVYDQEGGLLTVSAGPWTGGRVGPLRSETGAARACVRPDRALLAPRRCTSSPTRCGTCSSWPSTGRSTFCAPGGASTAWR
jgi:hypothetical protein